MKTLDEVIDNFEKACDLERRCEGCSGCLGQENGCPNDGAECVPDALHYLKEYREKSHQLDIGIAENRRFFEQYGEEMQRIHEIEDEYHELKDWWAEEYVMNDPLTWDELKQMEGKPVWVKDGLENGEWYIVECFTESGRFIAHDRYADDTVFKAIDMGNMWKAYRKERS